MSKNHKNTDPEIDDLIDRWHESSTIGISLHEFLGMSWEEYKQWIVNRRGEESNNYI